MTSSLVERRPALTYLVVTFALSWSAWAAMSRVPPDSTAATALFVSGGLGPFAAALVLRAVGRRSVVAWLRDILSPDAPAWTYVVAVVVPVVAVLVAAALHIVAFGGAWNVGVLPSLLEAPLIFLFIVFLGGGLEEPGWRGHLLPVVQRDHSALAAAIGIGIVWACWHLPLFVLPGTTQSAMSFWLYVPNVVAISVLLTALTNAASGLVLPAIVLHAGVNTIANYYPAGGAAVAIRPTAYGLLTAVAVLLAAGVVWWFGGETLAPGATVSAER